MKKRGISPVIATVLLIGIVVVIAIIVFMWIRGISGEAITTFDGTNVKLVCEEVSFDAQFSDGQLYLSNNGQVPIFKMKMRIQGVGSHETKFIEENWPSEGLLQGGTYAGAVTEPGNKILLIPVLIGSTTEGTEKAHTCDERHGIEVLME